MPVMRHRGSVLLLEPRQPEADRLASGCDVDGTRTCTQLGDIERGGDMRLHGPAPKAFRWWDEPDGSQQTPGFTERGQGHRLSLA